MDYDELHSHPVNDHFRDHFVNDCVMPAVSGSDSSSLIKSTGGPNKGKSKSLLELQEVIEPADAWRTFNIGGILYKLMPNIPCVLTAMSLGKTTVRDNKYHFCTVHKKQVDLEHLRVCDIWTDHPKEK